MARREVIGGLAGNLFGLGDRLRQQGNTEQQTAIQKRYLGMAESKMNEEVKRAQKQEAHANFDTLAKLEAINLLKAAKKDITDANVQSVMPEAYKSAYGKTSPGTRALLGPDFTKMFFQSPLAGGDIPAPAIPPGGPSQPFTGRGMAESMGNPMSVVPSSASQEPIFKGLINKIHQFRNSAR